MRELNEKEQAELEKEWTAKLLDGDMQAFEYLVERYHPKLIHSALYYVKSYTDAHDVVQEAVIKSYLNIASFRGDSHFYTWIYRIVTNEAKNFLYKKQKNNMTSIVSHEDTLYCANIQDIPELNLDNKEIQEWVLNNAENLPERLRLTYLLRDIYGMPYKDIAETIGCSIGTVRSRLFRARQKLSDDYLGHL